MALKIAGEIKENWTRTDITSLVERYNTYGGRDEVIRILKERNFEKQILQIPDEFIDFAIEELICELKGI